MSGVRGENGDGGIERREDLKGAGEMRRAARVGRESDMLTVEYVLF